MAKYYSVKCRNDEEQYYHRVQPKKDSGPARSAFKNAAKLQFHNDFNVELSDITLSNFQSNQSQPHDGSVLV